MKMPCFLKKLLHSLKATTLADKCLLVFMLILMLQSAYNLYSSGPRMQESNAFNVIIRTTAAAIFGYFISANFQNGGRDIPEDEHTDVLSKTTAVSSSKTEGQTRAQIGFSPSLEPTELKVGHSEHNSQKQPEQRDRLQIIVIASIGISSLLLLIIAYNYLTTDVVPIATISQLRDYVSGSVGFLIGHTTNTTKSS